MHSTSAIIYSAMIVIFKYGFEAHLDWLSFLVQWEPTLTTLNNSMKYRMCYGDHKLIIDDSLGKYALSGVIFHLEINIYR